MKVLLIIALYFLALACGKFIDKYGSGTNFDLEEFYGMMR